MGLLFESTFINEDTAFQQLGTALCLNNPVRHHCGITNGVRFTKHKGKIAHRDLRFGLKCEGQFTVNVRTVLQAIYVPLQETSPPRHYIEKALPYRDLLWSQSQ